MSRSVISVVEVAEKQANKHFKLVDASWHMPAQQRDARQEYLDGHIARAVFFDLDECVTESPLPHMLPSPAQFAAYARALGLSNDDEIVVYDTQGIFSAARVWWMFKQFGAKQVSVLDGGLPAWQAANLPLNQGVVNTLPGSFEATDSTPLVATAADVLSALQDSTTSVVLDARSLERFSGEQKEPRQGLRSGHMPGARCMPYHSLLNNGHLKPNVELEQLLVEYLDKRIITSCGSGVTAAIICLALEAIGAEQVQLYDGSWSEWGADAALPVVTGRAG